MPNVLRLKIATKLIWLERSPDVRSCERMRISVGTKSNTANNAEDSRLIAERRILNCWGKKPLHSMVQGAEIRRRRQSLSDNPDDSVFPGRLQ